MDIYFFKISRNTDDHIFTLYVDSWSLVVECLSSLEGIDDSVVISRCKLICKNADS